MEESSAGPLLTVRVIGALATASFSTHKEKIRSLSKNDKHFIFGND